MEVPSFIVGEPFFSLKGCQQLFSPIMPVVRRTVGIPTFRMKTWCRPLSSRGAYRYSRGRAGWFWQLDRRHEDCGQGWCNMHRAWAGPAGYNTSTRYMMILCDSVPALPENCINHHCAAWHHIAASFLSMRFRTLIAAPPLQHHVGTSFVGDLFSDTRLYSQE